MEMFLQIYIAIVSALSIWIISRREKWSRWGFVIGILAQPAWFYTTYINDQYGMFALTLFYFYCNCQGIYNYFIKEGN